MGIEPKQLLDHVIRPTLAELAEYQTGINSPSAERLLLLTAAHESHLGRWLVQRGGGPARGIYQMETHAAVDAATAYHQMNPGSSDGGYRTVNLRWATILARLYYWPVPKALPDPEDVMGLARYWHAYWCRGCRGTPEKAAQNYQSLVLARIGTWD